MDYSLNSSVSVARTIAITISVEAAWHCGLVLVGRFEFGTQDNANSHHGLYLKSLHFKINNGAKHSLSLCALCKA